jgi:hypothetical protein
MKWGTRERPKIDRIACPWLISRFIDPAAEFLFVPPAEVLKIGQATAAIPYDIPGVELSHVGERCSFDAFLAKYLLDEPALQQLATIVRGADTARLDLAPQCAGLYAISLGLGHVFADDHALLAHGLVMYDALYAWCRQGRGETHAWPPRSRPPAESSEPQSMDRALAGQCENSVGRFRVATFITQRFENLLLADAVVRRHVGGIVARVEPASVQPLAQQAPARCTGGHLTVPYEQNTQQSPGCGRSRAPQLSQSWKNTQASTGIVCVERWPQRGQVRMERVCMAVLNEAAATGAVRPAAAIRATRARRR